jgi:hypothetical protein
MPVRVPEPSARRDIIAYLQAESRLSNRSAQTSVAAAPGRQYHRQ